MGNFKNLRFFLHTISHTCGAIKPPWRAATNKMEGKILEAIYHVKSISKKKPSYKNIFSYIQKSTASNIDLEQRYYIEVIAETVSNMVTKIIIDKDFRILPQISDDVVETLYLEKGSEILQKSTHEWIDNLETTPLASLQGTPNLPNSIAKGNTVEANLMAIKSYFMDEVYELIKPHRNW